MRPRLSRPAVWSVPVVVTGAVLAATLAPGMALGSGHPKLARRSAAQLLAAVESSSVQHLTGTVVETTRLGLPDLPGADRSATLNWQALIAGSHTVRIWANGPTQQRLAVIGRLSEADVVRNGSDLWTYTSSDNAVTHAVLPAKSGATEVGKPATPTGSPTDPAALTPQAAAAQALRAIDPSTKVAVDTTAEVAGRSAYTLSLTPKDARSTVRRVLIAIDSTTSVPLRVQVFGSGVAAAFETAFTDVSFSQPRSSVFRFHAPKGAVVTTQGLRTHRAPSAPGASAPAKPAITVLGAGWTSILSLPAPSRTASTAGGRPSSASMLDRLFTTLPHHQGRLLHSALINVLVTPDGRVFVGAVQPGLLEKAAGQAG